MNHNKIIIGIDPGTLVMGYGIIKSKNGDTKPILVQYGVIDLKSYGTLHLRLQKIWDRLSAIAEEYQPDMMAIESPFYGKNIQVVLKLGRVQGISMAVALKQNIPIVEYSPREVKQTLTGHGNASKQQVAGMVTQIFSLEKGQNTVFDSTDALAIALCAFYKKNTNPQKKQSWKSFVQQNPNMINHKP